KGWGHPAVAAAVEVRGTVIGRVRLQAIKDTKGETLRAFVTTHIAPGSMLATDGSHSYIAVEAAGYPRERYPQFGTKARVLPSVHRVISLCKRWLSGTHQGAVEPKHLQKYCDEYTFRFNRRNSKHPGRICAKLLGLALSGVGPTYPELVGGT